MKQSPIIIAGFGRSGTTWLSDILSKALGGLILFEPFHPGVYDESEVFCYASSFSKQKKVGDHLKRCLTEPPQKNNWLLRNHLNTPLVENSQAFVEYIWDNTEVLGFKSIRSNHCLAELASSIKGKVIYIYRHPLAVLSSILNRKNFWEEYGWEWHESFFFKRTFEHPLWSKYQLDTLKKIYSNVKSNKEKTILMMWSISLIISLREIDKCDGILLSYESLYLDPYEETKRILINLGHNHTSLHPSYFFTPSLTTMNTIHNRKDLFNSGREYLDELFWSSKVDKYLTYQYQDLVKEVLSVDDKALGLAQKNLYF